MKRRFLALAMLAISTPGLAQDQAPGGAEGRSTLSTERFILGPGRFSLATGFDFSSGKYGTADSTDILYVPVTGKYQTDKATIKVTVPYIRITGPGGVAYGIGPLGETTATTIVTTDSGLGDVITSAGYTVYEDDTLALDLVGKIKFGTADANKGLGTGKTDYSAQIDGDYTRNTNTFFGTVGYKKYGAPVDGETLRNVPYGTIGASHRLGNRTRAGAMFYMKQSPSIFTGNQREATVYIWTKILPSVKVEANASRGFAKGSPDFGFGAMITHTF